MTLFTWIIHLNSEVLNSGKKVFYLHCLLPSDKWPLKNKQVIYLKSYFPQLNITFLLERCHKLWEICNSFFTPKMMFANHCVCVYANFSTDVFLKIGIWVDFNDSVFLNLNRLTNKYWIISLSYPRYWHT